MSQAAVMGLFSSSRQNRNTTYPDQYDHSNNNGGQGYFNQGRNEYDQNPDTITNGGNMMNHNRDNDFQGQQGITNNHGNHNLDHNTTYDRNNNIDTNGRHGLMNQNPQYDQSTNQNAHNSTNGSHGLFSRNNHHKQNTTLAGHNGTNNTTGQALPHYNATTSHQGMNTAHDTRHHGLSGHSHKDTTVDPSSSKGLPGRPSWFSRHRNRDTGATRSNRRSRSHSKNHGREKFDVNSGHYNRRPSFGQWLKLTWLDILTMIALGAVGLGVYHAHPAPSRSFPVYFQDGEIVYPQFAYPLRHEIVPIWLAALLAALIPIFIFLCMQIRIRSFWDVNNAIIGLLYSLITAAVFQVFLKWLIGGLRPHFLTVCAPILPNNGIEVGNGLNAIMYDRSICSGDPDEIDDSLESFPSGHSTAAFAGFVFLYLYLNAKLKVFSNHHPAMWKLIATYAPILGATLIAGTLTIDEYHNWYDCLAGAVIGTVMAFSAYRMVYASVWDFRFNHIPLTRHTPFSYGAGEAGAGGFETAVFSRTAGWGYEEAYGGAPFDAAHNLRGGMTGFNQGVHNDHHHHNKDGGLTSNHEKSLHGSHHGINGVGAEGHNHHNRTEQEGTIGAHHQTQTGGGLLNSHHHQPTHSQQNNNTTHTNTGLVDNNNRSSAFEPTTTHPYTNNNTNTNTGPIDNNRGGALDPAITPTRSGGRYRQQSKSLERRPVGSGRGGGGDGMMV